MELLINGQGAVGHVKDNCILLYSKKYWDGAFDCKLDLSAASYSFP